MSLYTHPGGEVTLLPPPTGYQVDFDHPQRQFVQQMYWVSGVMNFIALLFVAQRVYTNLYIQKRCFASYWLVTHHSRRYLILRTVVNGSMGTHAYEMVLDKFLTYLHNFYPMPIIYPLCITAAKLSLLIFYIRLSPVQLYRFAVYFGIFFIAGSNIGLAFATAFPCKPLELAWNPLILGTCIDRPATYKATAILGLMVDIYIIILPIPTVINLQIPRRQKIGLIALFTVGLCTIATSILRLVVIIQQLSNADVSWGSGPTDFWLIIEAYLMVICATLPSLRKFLRHISPRLIGERSTNNNDKAKESSSNNLDIITFGRLKNNHTKFSREIYGLETMTAIEIGGQLRAGLHEECEQSSTGDNNSQKGILQT
ncbi:hypothetical protein F5884DRAFT_717660 [Xylogone sp. PMI_703]|nr:hypothetical protein F5884DRAFT_717660 [Xylogone sp. PMI_703]